MSGQDSSEKNRDIHAALRLQRNVHLGVRPNGPQEDILQYPDLSQLIRTYGDLSWI
jgi:hypothetical protein